MAKVKPTLVFVDQGYLYLIDDKGQVYSKHMPNGQWQRSFELPDAEEVKPQVRGL